MRSGKSRDAGGESKARNQRIQNMLRMIGYGENIGSGFPLILSAWNEKHWIKPELIEQTELMQVKLVLHVLNEGDTQSVPQGVPQDVPQTIIELIYNNPNITREDIAKQIGVSTKTIGRYLKKLENKVKFVGSGYSGHWEIIQK